MLTYTGSGNHIGVPLFVFPGTLLKARFGTRLKARLPMCRKEQNMANVGRPLKFQSVPELEEKINEYFSVTPKDEWTWTGLALHLDTTKETLREYKAREDFVAPLKKALLMVENGYETDLKKHGRSGTIFALKNFDWKDKTETDITTLGESINDMSYAKAKAIIAGKGSDTGDSAE